MVTASFADVAQPVVQLIRNQQVGGSIPPISSKQTKNSPYGKVSSFCYHLLLLF